MVTPETPLPSPEWTTGPVGSSSGCRVFDQWTIEAPGVDD
jgi:hypothetical protein